MHIPAETSKGSVWSRKVVTSCCTSFCGPKKQHGRSTWRSVLVLVPCLASPLVPPHLPCNITNGGDRCSQLLHAGLQLVAVRGASWLQRTPLVVRPVHKAALAPHTGQRSESCVVSLSRFDGIFHPFFSCPSARVPSCSPFWCPPSG